MAMIQCPECSYTVSQTAKSCPQCGCNIKKLVRAQKAENAHPVVKFFAAFVAIALFVCAAYLLGFVALMIIAATASASEQLESYRTFDHGSPVSSVYISSDGQRAYSAGGWLSFGNIKLWDVKSGKLEHEYNGHLGIITAMDISYRERYIASGSIDNTVIVWDGVSGEKLHVLKGHKSPIEKIEFVLLAFQFVSSDADGNIIYWDAASGEKFRKFNIGGAVADFDVSDDGNYMLVMPQFSDRLELHDFHTGELIDTYIAPAIPQAVAMHPQYEEFIAVGFWEPFCMIHHYSRYSGYSYHDADTTHSDEINSLRYSTDGDFALTASNDGTASIIRLFSDETEYVLSGHQDRVNDARWNPSGKLIATGSNDQTIKIWRVPPALTPVNGWENY